MVNFYETYDGFKANMGTRSHYISEVGGLINVDDVSKVLIRRKGLKGHILLFDNLDKVREGKGLIRVFKETDYAVTMRRLKKTY